MGIVMQDKAAPWTYGEWLHQTRGNINPKVLITRSFRISHYYKTKIL
jgi:hypothetical protein